MKRLNQLVTRLLIVALIFLAAWVGRAHIGKRALVYHLESYVGARVDAKQLHLNGKESTVFLNQVEIANPQNDQKNLLQFEAASLKLDFEQLKNRRIVIEDGRLSQIKFAAPRTTSGRLERGIFDPPLPANIASSEEDLPVGVLQSGGVAESWALAQRWRDSLVVDVNQSNGPVASTFEVGPLLKQKTQLWGERFAEPVEQMTQVGSSLAMVEEVLSVPADRLNPLRSGNKLKDAIAAIESSQQSLQRVGTLIKQFESLSQKDVYELSQVQMRDRQSLVTNEKLQEFDEKLINELLLGEVQRQLVANGVTWFQHFRNSLPDPETDFRTIVRGRDVMFGTEAKPKFEIRKLQIDGAAEFANSHFNFAGTIENICDIPTANDRPMKFNLRAQGDPQVVVSGTLDRRNGKNVDSIHFTGHAIPQPDYTLGSKESIQVSMTNQSRLYVDANLSASSDDQIGGTIIFTFEDVVMHADSVHEVAGGAETAARLNETVSGINSFRITSTLGGTVLQPTATFASDLGPQLASSLEKMFRDAQLLAMKKREHQLNRTIDGDLVAFKENVAGGIAQLNESWRASYSRLNGLKKRLTTARGPQLTRPNRLR